MQNLPKDLKIAKGILIFLLLCSYIYIVKGINFIYMIYTDKMETLGIYAHIIAIITIFFVLDGSKGFSYLATILLILGIGSLFFWDLVFIKAGMYSSFKLSTYLSLLTLSMPIYLFFSKNLQAYFVYEYQNSNRA